MFDLVEHAPDDLLHLFHILLLHIYSLLEQIVYFEQLLQLAQCVVIFFGADLSLIALDCSPLTHFNRFAELPLLLYFWFVFAHTMGFFYFTQIAVDVLDEVFVCSEFWFVR